MTYLNVELLSRLVTWAAESELVNTNPAEAETLGLLKKDSQRLGRWDQNTWARADRNGICKTAFCIAGGAIALDDESMIVMSPLVYGADGSGSYLLDSVVPKALVPEDADTKFGYWWLKNDEDLSDHVSWDERTTASEKGRALLGLDYEDAERLFNGDNEIEDVVSLSVMFAEEEGQKLDLPEWVLDRYFDASRTA